MTFYQCFPAAPKWPSFTNLRRQPSHFWPHSALLHVHLGGTIRDLGNISNPQYLLLWCESQCLLHGVCCLWKVIIYIFNRELLPCLIIMLLYILQYRYYTYINQKIALILQVFVHCLPIVVPLQTKHQDLCGGLYGGLGPESCLASL